MQKIEISSTTSQQTHAISCICGHCGNNISLKVFANYYNEHTNEYIYFTGQCPFCGKPVIYDKKKNLSIPYISTHENIKYLPENIATLYNEIKESFAVSSYTCCVITARTLMAHIAVEQGAEDNKSFVDYVNYLQQNCLPLKTNNAWVDKIRQLGNDSTHKLVIATKEDAESSIKFIIAILKNVYEFPNSI